MKIDLSATPVQATVHAQSQPAQPATQPDPTAYKANEVKLTQADPLYMLKQQAKDYVTQFGYRVVGSIQEALLLRKSGQKVLSFREADIATRKQLNLANLLLARALNDDAWLMVEDIAGYPDSTYELRAFYNRGVQFFVTRANHVDPLARRRAREAMDSTIKKLADRGVPAYPDEIDKGFALELCKPDFMTWDQYRKRMEQPFNVQDIQEDVTDLAASVASTEGSSE